MDQFRPSPPTTSRDHEIVALANKFLQHCGNQNYAVILAAAAQVFLNTVNEFRAKPLPPDVAHAAKLLSRICQEIRSLPQARVQ